MADEFFTVLDLPAEQLRQAYPLIQASSTSWTLDQWLEYADRSCHDPDQRGGILSVQNSARYIYALAAYRIEPCQPGGQILEVEHFCMVGLFNGSIGPPLVQALEQRAKKENCSEIRVGAPEGADIVGWISRQMPGGLLRRLGYAGEANLLTKALQ